jgi:Cu(I)/Ag(I) efflux system membrane protein CusA/SilA
LLKELDNVVRMPGWSNIWTQPIVNRIDMLATGVQTMIGVKVFGNNLEQIQKASDQVADVLRKVPGAVTVVADQIRGKGYLEVKIDRHDRAQRPRGVGRMKPLCGKITMTSKAGSAFPSAFAGRWHSRSKRMNLLIAGVGHGPEGGAMSARPRPPSKARTVARAVRCQRSPM